MPPVPLASVAACTSTADCPKSQRAVILNWPGLRAASLTMAWPARLTLRRSDADAAWIGIALASMIGC